MSLSLSTFQIYAITVTGSFLSTLVTDPAHFYAIFLWFSEYLDETNLVRQLFYQWAAKFEKRTV